MEEKKKVSIEKKLGTQEAVAFLQDLVTSLKNGKTVVEKGEKFVSLTPSDTIKLEIDASQKSEKGKIKFKLAWKNEKVEEPKEEKPEKKIAISSIEPEVTEEDEEAETA